MFHYCPVIVQNPVYMSLCDRVLQKCVNPALLFVFVDVWHHVHYESLLGLKMQHVVVGQVEKVSLQTN